MTEALEKKISSGQIKLLWVAAVQLVAVVVAVVKMQSAITTNADNIQRISKEQAARTPRVYRMDVIESVVMQVRTNVQEMKEQNRRDLSELKAIIREIQKNTN